MSAAALEQGRERHRRGDLAGAIALYQLVLRDAPGDAVAWHLKGVAEHQAGTLDAALASAAQAIAHGGREPSYLLLEGGVLHDRGALGEAEARFDEAARAAPRWAMPLVELARVRMDAGRADEALTALQAAVAAEPGYGRAWATAGNCLAMLDRHDQAERALGEALRLDPRDALSRFNLARLHSLRADGEGALREAEAAARIDPGLAAAHRLAGDLRRRRHELDAALTAYGHAIRAAPRELGTRFAQADLLAEAGHAGEAQREYGHVATHFPGSLRAALGAELTLPPVYESVAHLDECRERFAAGMERLHAASGRFAGQEPRWANFLLAYQGRDDMALQTRYGELLTRVLPPAELRETPRRERVRVGFVSHFFHDHPVGRYFRPWIRGLDPERFEVFTYASNELRDATTAAIATSSAIFRPTAGHVEERIAAAIAADQPDVLVYPELGMHGATMALAARRLAPRQLAAWGHPVTSGLATIDGFLSVAAMEPEGAQASYREPLLLLPGIGTAYAFPEGAHGKAPQLPEGRRYLVPQSLFKIHPDNDTLLAEVLARDPAGMLVMFASPWPEVTRAFLTRIGRAFTSRGVDASRRVAMIQGYLPHADYRALNAACDVMLDTLHWSGGNTSLDALGAGLPVVTLPGPLMRGRQSAAMLRAAGAPELIAGTPGQYVELALTTRRGDWERRLREGAANLADPAPIERLGEILYSPGGIAR